MISKQEWVEIQTGHLQNQGLKYKLSGVIKKISHCFLHTSACGLKFIPVISGDPSGSSWFQSKIRDTSLQGSGQDPKGGLVYRNEVNSQKSLLTLQMPSGLRWVQIWKGTTECLKVSAEGGEGRANAASGGFLGEVSLPVSCRIPRKEGQGRSLKTFCDRNFHAQRKENSIVGTWLHKPVAHFQQCQYSVILVLYTHKHMHTHRHTFSFLSTAFILGVCVVVWRGERVWSKSQTSHHFSLNIAVFIFNRLKGCFF